MEIYIYTWKYILKLKPIDGSTPMPYIFPKWQQTIPGKKGARRSCSQDMPQVAPNRSPFNREYMGNMDTHSSERFSRPLWNDECEPLSGDHYIADCNRKKQQSSQLLAILGPLMAGLL